jgi:hypothetical protein
VRDYHPVKWDLADDSSKLPEWPFAKNRVSWEKVYGSWHEAGLKISVCLMFDEMKPAEWKDMPRDAEAYARSFAENFGPGGKWPFVECLELGNEPGLLDDATYRTIFEAMARGIRAGNPKMKIATCNVEAGPSDRYWKGVDCFKGFDSLYDVVHIHRYAIAEGWPVWRRTYPEDTKAPFLSTIQKLIDWRNANAPDKQVWVTEFGWDSSTKKPDPKGEWAKWTGSTDEQQAQWNVRAYLLLAGMGVEKSFLYFFNDKDEPKLHAASGITRNYEPKPAYHAVAWMLRSLADYRFSRIVKQSPDEGYVYEFKPEKSGEPVILAAWHPTRAQHEMTLNTEGMKMQRAERMPLTRGNAETVSVTADAHGGIAFSTGERPCLLWMVPQ